MKVFFWNCRGFINSNTQRIFSQYCRQYKPGLLCIIEHMVHFQSSSSRFWSFLGLFFIAANNISLPSIWILGNSLTLVSLWIHFHQQRVTLNFYFQNKVHRITFVYGNVWSHKRVELWHDLLNLATSAPNYWLAIGDFNAILGSYEKMGRSPAIRSYNEFH